MTKGNEVLDDVIVGRVVPHIYAFETNTYPQYLKVGDTYRPVSRRLGEWSVRFPKLREVYRCEAVIKGTEVYFRDYSVHSVLEEKDFKRLDKNTAAKITGSENPPFSNEFFHGVQKVDVEKAVAEVQNDYTAHAGKFDFYRVADIVRNKDEAGDDDPPVELKLRENQREVVENFKRAVAENRTDLLMYAVMRFGKTVTALACAKAMDARFVVVVSGKADVRREWRKAVRGFACFSDYVFVTQSDVGNNYDYITNLLQANKRVVYFDTLQDFCDTKGKVAIKPKHRQIFRQKIDLLIVDETHFAARAENCGMILQDGMTVEAKPDDESEEKDVGSAGCALKELNEKVLKAKVKLHLSGTPYRILMGGEFRQKDIVAFCSFTDIADAQRKWDEAHLGTAKPDGSEYEEWDNDYFGFPEMVRFAFNLNKSSLAKLEELEKLGVSSRFGELLRTQSLAVDKSAKKRHRKFVHEAEVVDLFQTIGGVKSDPSILNFLDYERIRTRQMCRHIVCVLPWKASCDALEKLLGDKAKDFGRLGEYVVLNIAGHGCKKGCDTPDKVIRLIEANERDGKKTLTLTVDRMLTGSTVPEWDTMLFLKDTSSPQQYDQAIFRLQSSFIREMTSETGKRIRYNMKPQTLLVDFDPHRMFYLQEQRAQYYNVNMGDKGNAAVMRRIGEELAVSPVVRFGADGIHRVTPTDVMAAVSAYNAKRGVADEAREVPVTKKELADPNMQSVLARYAPMGSREGLAVQPHKGETTDGNARVDGEPGETTTPPQPLPEPKTESEFKDRERRLHTFRSMILFFAFLTKDQVATFDDILARMDASDENRRIVRNLGILKSEIDTYRQALDWHTQRSFELKIHNMNWLSREEKDIDLGADYADVPAGVRRAIVAMNQFGRLGKAKIVTPPNIAYDMVKQIPAAEYRKLLRRGEKILDLSAKMGEFAIAEVRRALDKDVGLRMDDIRSSLLAIPMCGITYEFTRKVYELLGLDASCVAEPERLNTYDLLKYRTGNGKVDYVRIRRVLTQDKPFDKITIDDPVVGKEDSMCMKIGAVISNPPYQMGDGGHASSAMPIYQEYVRSSFAWVPEFSSMIIPARWFSGGRGLGEFRTEMVADKRLVRLNDFYDSADCFPNIDLSGGVCYFLWESKQNGKCSIQSHVNGITSVDERYLKGDLEGDTYVRFKEAMAILAKVSKDGFTPITAVLSANDPFGFDLREEDSFRRVKPDIKPDRFDGSVGIYYFDKVDKRLGYVARNAVRKNVEHINGNKVFISAAYGERGKGPYQVLGKPFFAGKGTVCTETYLSFGPFESRAECDNLCSYVATRFFRFLVMQKKSTQHAMKSVYDFVPMQDFNEPWTDEKLYKKYGITKEEQAFIESLIKPMA